MLLLLFSLKMERVARLGGAHAPFEIILQYVGGRMPGGPDGSPAEAVWQRMRSWMVLSQTWFHAWLQYQRDI